ncbi:hypothetical protein EMPS_07274 [Entomortierella parvispora]|uniref:NAD(P)-binding protein n=1 Tax=Entomortierella parvispora TaxID=205924 RepID=A0A9P3HDT9_9FUNG|nr:hypothetical protein EMPS_07274 [Entomortierella parvispora]
MPFTVKDFLKDQFMSLNITPQDLTGKTIVVTGSNVGIGYGTVCHLAGMHPARIILACRNTSKAEEAIRKIKATASINSEGVIFEAQELNLASFASCRAFAKKYQESGLPIHILINNAGITSTTFSLTEDNHESIFATNHLGTVLLTLLLLPIVRKTAAQDASTYPRIIVVASEMHHWGPLTSKDSDSFVRALDDPTNVESFKQRYPDSKLMNVLFTRSLATHLKASSHPQDKKITVSVINPGLVASEFGTKSEVSIWSRLGFTVMMSIMRGFLARNIMDGAKTTVFAAIEPECGIENGAENGLYYSSCRVAPVNPIVEGEEGKALGERLWKETIETIQTTPTEFDI